MGNGATGPRNDRVYSIAFEDVHERGLFIRPDPKLPFAHAFIEPSSTLAFGLYEAALQETRPSWRQVWP